MTRQTQVARMARCAARRNADLARSAHDTRKLSMSPEPESRIVVRAGPGKTRNLFTGETRSLRETNVTLSARLARHIEVGGLQAVTPETLCDNCVADGHPLCATLNVTRGTVSDQRAVGNVPSGCRNIVSLMSEPAISRARSGSRLPCHFWLDHSVVT